MQIEDDSEIHSRYIQYVSPLASVSKYPQYNIGLVDNPAKK